MNIQSEWIVSADQKTDVFDNKAELLKQLQKHKVYLVKSCAKLSAVVFHRSIILSGSKPIAREVLPLENTRVCEIH